MDVGYHNCSSDAFGPTGQALEKFSGRASEGKGSSKVRRLSFPIKMDVRDDDLRVGTH
jgi:hypothetical protein